MATSQTASDFMQPLFAERIGGRRFGQGTEIYKFEKIKRAKAAAQRARPDLPLIDMGVGEPDAMADPGVVQTLAAEAALPENRFYADNGIPEFKEAAARYMARVFGVTDLDPETEINHAIGAKSALTLLPLAFINPGDVTIMPLPSYPVLGTHTRYLGGEVAYLPLEPSHGFLPDLGQLDAEVLRRAKLLYLNYPNAPTGASANRDFLTDVVRFAKKHGILVVYDAAYAALTFDGAEPLSFLSIPGAKECGVEIHSLSKAFNMTGWRIAFVAGNARAVEAFATVKDNSDSGQFRAIQKAAIYALDHPEITERTAAKYSRRHDLLVAALSEVGFAVSKPQASFYLYTPIPKAASGRTFRTAEEFSEFLIMEQLISTVPFDDVGAYVRWSVTFSAADEEAERSVVAEVKRRLSRLELVF
ncbi:MAG TPA: LL-diaminopimelate aminotransferase [Limnochordia bacterium]